MGLMGLKVIKGFLFVVTGTVVASWLINVIAVVSTALFGNLENGYWAIIITTVFGGIVAALAIYIAFSQSNKLHTDTKKYMIKEKRYERKLAELERIRSYIGDIVTQSLKLHVISRLHDIPDSKEDLDLRKQNMLNLHTFLEDNFNGIFALGLMFNYTAEDVTLSNEEESFYKKRRALSNEYRALYKILHYYLNFILNKLEVLYKADGFWIWDLTTDDIREKPIAYEGSDKAFDETKAWMLVNGVKTNIEPSGPGGLPRNPLYNSPANDVMQRSNLRNHLQNLIIQASREEQDFLDKTSDMVLGIRVKLVDFLATATDLEEAILHGDIILKNNISMEGQLELFMAEKAGL